MSLMEMAGFGNKMKEFLGILMGEFLSCRVRIEGKTQDVRSRDPKTGAKVLVGNVMTLEYQKMKMICQATKSDDSLEIMLAPKKQNAYISDEYLDTVNRCLENAREKMIRKMNKSETDFEQVVLTKLTALTMGAAGGAQALLCSNCKAPIPHSRTGKVVCPYCNTTNLF